MAIVLSVGLIGCSAVIDVKADAAGNVAVSCNAGLGAAFMDVMRAMNGAGDAVSGGATSAQGTAAPLLTAEDCAGVARNLAKAGLAGAVVSTPTADSIEVRGTVVADKLNLLTDTGCVTVSSTGGKRVLSLVLNPSTLGALYARLNEDIQAYLDLAMAGVFTGEAMTAAEWLSSLEVVYGKQFAEEAGRAKVTVNMSVTGDGGKDERRTFTVPLTDIMTGRSVAGKVEG